MLFRSTDVALGSLISGWIGFHAIQILQVFVSVSAHDRKYSVIPRDHLLSVTLVLILVASVRRVLEIFVLNNPRTRDKRIFLILDWKELREERSKLRLLWVFVRFVVTASFIYRFFILLSLTNANLSHLAAAIFAIAFSLISVTPEFIKSYQSTRGFDPETRSTKLHLLNFKGSMKLFIVILVSTIAKHFESESGKYALLIYVVFALSALFTILEVFFKRTEKQEQLNINFPLIYYPGGVLVFLVILCNVFSIGFFS